MGAIVAFKPSAPNDDERRRQGMQFLGEQVMEGVKNADSEQTYADGLADALKAVIKDPDHTLWYEFNDQNGNKDQAPIDAASAQGKKVTCDLAGTNKHLILHVQLDGKDGNDFKMNVPFPANNEAGFAYLETVGNDVHAIQDTSARQQYLVPFKFLSRCR